MRQLDLNVDGGLERELRRFVVKKIEPKEGFLKSAMEEAIRDRINEGEGG